MATAALAGVVVLLPAAVLALKTRLVEERRTLCQTNLRRLSTALLLYAQDHDSALPPPEYQAKDRRWRHWMDIADPYLGGQNLTVCPANRADGAISASHRYPYPISYALNERFFGIFAPGPFPVENVEMPAQTAMVVESGIARATSPFDPPPAGVSEPLARPIYGDTGLTPLAFPSPHGGRMNVVAADSHVVSIKVAHYDAAGHDAAFGRLGGSIYNWNGGHPNGEMSAPPRE